jgi:outer membrane protein assembly factor BamB
VKPAAQPPVPTAQAGAAPAAPAPAGQAAQAAQPVAQPAAAAKPTAPNPGAATQPAAAPSAAQAAAQPQAAARPQAAAQPQAAPQPQSVAQSAPAAPPPLAAAAAIAATPGAATRSYRFRVTPAEASIVLDGQSIGTGNASAELEIGSRHEAVFSAPGFADQRTAFTVQKTGTAALTVKLAGAARTLSFTAVPPEATIVVNGKQLGRGSGRIDVANGDRCQVIVTLRGYARQDQTFVVGPATPDAMNIALAPSAIWDRLKAGKAAIVGIAVDDAGLIVASDAVSALAAFAADGKPLWTKATDNAPNAASVPVIAGDEVCFSVKELWLLGAADGAMRNRAALPPAGVHDNGGRVLPVQNTLVMPLGAGLGVSDRSGRQLRTIAADQAVRSTPALWNDNLVVLSEDGTVGVYAFKNGRAVRSIPTDADVPAGAAPLIVQNRAYFADRSGRVFAVDLAGSLLWSVDAGVPPGGTGVELVSDGRALFGRFGSKVIGLDLADGRRLFAPLSGVATPPLAAAAGLVYGTVSGALEVRDPATGALRRSISLGDQPSGRPALAGELIAIGTVDGSVLLVNPAGQ